MTWKLGVLWGILITVVEWLGYLAQRGGVDWAAKPLLLVTLALFVYVGYSAFRINRRVIPSLLTSLLAGLIAGFFSALALFLAPGQGFLSVIQQSLMTAFSAGLFAVLLGAIGALWARVGYVTQRGAPK
ncbi:MAG: hypothetical protein M0Z66_02620 [Thermaerobacter sp.]|nr:hypothetical protein [Thermaerobacter sp.]